MNKPSTSTGAPQRVPTKDVKADDDDDETVNLIHVCHCKKIILMIKIILQIKKM
jgi:hypothetical protein